MLLELFRGPTFAFKDVALQFLGKRAPADGYSAITWLELLGLYLVQGYAPPKAKPGQAAAECAHDGVKSAKTRGKLQQHARKTEA